MKYPFALLSLFAAAPLPAQIVITEFMADNTRTLADEDGGFNDWIELHNPTAMPVSLDDWALTDDAAAMQKWLFPDGVTVPAKGYLLVWASNKNKRVPGQPLHTNFRLDNAGEYLALVKPDLSTATAFAPAFPVQIPDLSYGPAAETTVTTAIAQGAAGKVLVPADGSQGTSWTGAAFDDSAWTAATNGIGFETGANEFGTGWTGEILADGPTGFYRLEETGVIGIAAANGGSLGGSGTGSYLNGVTQNAATVQSPVFPGWEGDNLGARFDGTNDKVDVPFNAALNTATFSFSFWMKWNGGIVGTHKCPLASRESVPQRGFICYVLPTTQQLSFWTGASTAWDTLDAPAGAGTIAANTWYHVAGTFDGITRQKTLYLNGVQVGQKTAAVYALNTQFPLRIGAGSTEGAGSFWFPGDIDEVAVFNRVLSAGEVTTQYTSATAAGTGTEAAAAITTQAPVGWWRLKDPGTATAVTAMNAGSAGPAASGTYSGAGTLGAAGPQPPSETGMPAGNKCFRMAGGGYVETPYSAALNPSVFTVECWARATGGAGTFRAAVSGRNDTGSQTQGYIFYAANGNTWQFWTGSGGSGVWDPINGPAVTLNAWVHLAGTFDGTTKRFYVNGAQVGTGTSSTFNPNVARGLRIGAGQNEGAANFLFQGDVDEVGIYSRALSAVEISARYALGKNNTAPPPVNDFTGLINTSLQAQMLNTNASAYFRIPFTIADASAVDGLTLKMKYDDGFQAYLNGVPVGGGNVPNTLTWNSAASERSSNAEAVVNETFSLNSALSSLQNGTNVLAIHGLNLDAANPDFLQLAQLDLTDVGTCSATPLYLGTATPGGVNSNGTSTPGPAISAEAFTPAAPTANDDITVTCRVQPVFSPIATVTLNWRTAYNAVQITPMLDNGTAGDVTGADGIYTAVISKTASGFVDGAMVRWFLTATDTSANTSRWPIFTAGSSAPEYFGTMVAATGFTTTLPVWYWFAQNTGAAATRGGTRGAVFYNGGFYDNIFIRLRGGFTSTGSKKFDFNTGAHCFINNTIGSIEEANINGTGSAESIIRPAISFEMYRRSGHPYSECFPVMIRVNGGLDTGSGRGGIAYFVEQIDERYLERHGFDRDGALYKPDQRANLEPVFTDAIDGVEKKTRLYEDRSDYQSLVEAVHSISPDDWSSASPGVAPVFPPGFTTTRTTKLFDMMNMANVVNYLATRVIIADTDDTRKNFYFYRDTVGSGEWHIFPWDKDYTHGVSADANPWAGHPFQGDYARRKVNGSNQWNYVWEGCFNEPKIRAMVLRRLRTLMDNLLGTSPGAPEALADAFWNPIMATTPLPTTFNGATDVNIKNFFTTRRNGALSTTTSSGLYSVYAAANGIAAGIQIPDAQPANAVVNFGSVDYLPASGNQDEEFVQISNPNSYDVDLSGWQLKRGVEHTFEPGTVVRANDVMYVAAKKTAFRARAVSPKGGEQLYIQGGYKGTISARGEIIELWDPMNPAVTTDDRLVATLNTPSTLTPAQSALRITEIMYDPPAGGSFAAGEYEFLELKNTSATPLNLSGATFTDGVTFTFGATTLNPGDYIVLVKNPAAFAERYGNTPVVAGTYTGALDNSGERLRIVDGVGEEVLDFRYEGTWYPNTHGSASLVIEDAAASYDTWGQQGSWRSSAAAHGNPGTTDPLPAAPVITGVTGTTIHLSGEATRTYILQRSLDLVSWSDLNSIAAPANDFDMADPAANARALYRVRSK